MPPRHFYLRGQKVNAMETALAPRWDWSKGVVEDGATGHKRQRCNDTGSVEFESLAYTRKDSGRVWFQ